MRYMIRILIAAALAVLTLLVCGCGDSNDTTVPATSEQNKITDSAPADTIKEETQPPETEKAPETEKTAETEGEIIAPAETPTETAEGQNADGE